MDRKQEEKIIQWMSMLTVLFFVLWGIQTLASGNTEFIFDRFFSAGIALIGFLCYRKMQLRLPVVLVGIFTLILHHLKLYGNFYFGIAFDKIMHVVAGFALALISYQYLNTIFQSKHRLGLFLFSLFVAFGFASSVEIIEFVGYSFLGQGEGILFYGTGDFGEWNNLSWDLMGNMVGAILGCGVMALLSRKNK